VQLFDADINYFSTSNKHTATNPLFVAATHGAVGTTSTSWFPGADLNFAIQPTSPLINFGQSESFLPASDADAGACNHALSICAAYTSY
jgi:hypothetical protein